MSPAAPPMPAPMPAQMPAEWEPHAATWLAWPHNHKDWPGKFATIPFVYAEIIRRLAVHERVELLVNDEAARAKATRVLAQAGAPLDRVRFHLQPTDRIWMRDSGCTFTRVDGALQAVKWRFNAWAKYDNWTLDETVGSYMARETGCPERRPLARGRRFHRQWLRSRVFEDVGGERFVGG